MSSTSKAGLVTFERNDSAKSTGDLRYTLNPDVGDVELFGEREQPVVVIPAGDGMVVRKTMPRNVYVPSDGADDSVESVTLRVELDSIQRVTAKPSQAESEGSESDAILDRLIASGDVDALATYLARTRDGLGPKSAKPVAEALIGS